MIPSKRGIRLQDHRVQDSQYLPREVEGWRRSKRTDKSYKDQKDSTAKVQERRRVPITKVQEWKIKVKRITQQEIRIPLMNALRKRTQWAHPVWRWIFTSYPEGIPIGPVQAQTKTWLNQGHYPIGLPQAQSQKRLTQVKKCNTKVSNYSSWWRC